MSSAFVSSERAAILGDLANREWRSHGRCDKPAKPSKVSRVLRDERNAETLALRGKNGVIPERAALGHELATESCLQGNVGARVWLDQGELLKVIRALV